jgi:hypothetical protein
MQPATEPDLEECLSLTCSHMLDEVGLGQYTTHDRTRHDIMPFLQGKPRHISHIFCEFPHRASAERATCTPNSSVSLASPSLGTAWQQVNATPYHSTEQVTVFHCC